MEKSMNRKPRHDRVRTYPDYLFRQYDSVLRAARYLKSGRFVLVFRQYDGVLRAARKKLSSNPVSGFSQVRCRGILFPIRARLRYVRRRPCGRTPFQILLHSGVLVQKVSKLKFKIRIFSNHFIFPVIPAISRLRVYPLRSHWVWGQGSERRKMKSFLKLYGYGDSNRLRARREGMKSSKGFIAKESFVGACGRQ